MTPEREATTHERFTEVDALFRWTEEVRREVMDTVARSRATRARVRLQRDVRLMSEAGDA